MENNTHRSFKDKWANNPDLAFKETLREGSDIFNWILNRNGFANATAFTQYLSTKKRILDAGCGNGRVTALISEYAPATSQIVGIDFSSAEVAAKNLSQIDNISIREGDLMKNLTHLGTFDFIYCQEVLHHTQSPYQSFANLCQILDKNGEIAIYVYKKKAAVREFVDDYVRNAIAHQDYNAALDISKQITVLGKTLSELNIQVEIPEVKVLDIEAGKYDLQRFFYHFFMKCFWNKDLSFEENAAVNYDWYHPQLCSRHTIEEVLDWFQTQNIRVIHQFSDFYGITIRGIKQT
jgi:SAM-dependent methyltransferase